MSGATFSACPTVISDTPSLETFLTDLTDMMINSRQSTRPEDKLELYIDLEGHNLSREGTFSLMTMLVYPSKRTYLIDVHTLGNLAFITRSTAPLDPVQPAGSLPQNTSLDSDMDNAKGKQKDSQTVDSNIYLTLKALLEDLSIPKYFWDVRNDADALFSHHCIRLAGVVDIQLFEVASRPGWPGDKQFLRGLDTCIDKDLQFQLPRAERNGFLNTKKEVRLMMDKARFRTDIFAQRPLSTKLIDYCTGDVIRLPALYELYKKRMKSDWALKALSESEKRVQEACSPGYKPHGPEKRFAPTAWSTGLALKKF